MDSKNTYRCVSTNNSYVHLFHLELVAKDLFQKSNFFFFISTFYVLYV